MSALAVPYNVGYGAVELKRSYKKFMTRGFTIATAFHLMVIGSYWASTLLSTGESAPAIFLRPPFELPPPPSLINNIPAIAVVIPGLKPSVGMPVPVPDAAVDPDVTIADQNQMNSDAGLPGGTTGKTFNPVEDVEPPMNGFVKVEKNPLLVTQVQPKYPEMARRAGIEGSVVLRALIDKEGKVRKVVVLKSNADILNQAAVDVALQWVFAPAIMNNGPVLVWVTIPFTFRLRGQ